MNSVASIAAGQIERELAYYRRECNDLGARLLRMQEEQSQAFREARRSRTVAKLIREAYRLVDTVSVPTDIGGAMLEVIIDNVICDRVAFLREAPRGSNRFEIMHAIGLTSDWRGNATYVPNPPNFFFTTVQTRIEPPAYELTGILQLPYILWSYDSSSGVALILGNKSESNVNRAFEPGDQELIEGALSVYLDVLVRKQAEHQLQFAKHAAEEAVNARAAFLATLSHELRTPLNAIIGFSEMMSSASAYPLTLNQCVEFADQIHESGEHLLALINDILEYSRLAKSPPALQVQWLPIDQVVVSAVRAATAAAEKRGVTLRTGELDSTVRLEVDPMRMRQVFDNLLSNALKFTPSDGVVLVFAEPCPEGGFAIVVRDTGVGMQPEDIPRAMEPFRQIHNAYTRTVPGTGLGLPITKALVEAHGARLEIGSELGRGTTARVIMPPERVRLGEVSPPAEPDPA